MKRLSLVNASLLFFISIIIIRVIAMWLLPLTDTTEARYGEIARKMLETSDWITLWHDYGVPFWAKPPLSTWLSALSMQLFGVNEFSARLPALLLAVGTVILIWHFTCSILGKSTALLASVILSGMSLFYISSGTVMTDMPLLFACVLVLVAFWFAVEKKSQKWGIIFFTGLGLGLLIKGIAALVLSLLPIFFWLVWTNRWKRMWRSLPWGKGILLMLLISLPWYIAAEIKTPGFLHYFLIGEHFNRFFIPSWQGDLYGNAHEESIGTIWLFLLVDSLPWILLIIPWTIYYKFTNKQAQFIGFSFSLNKHEKYLWCAFLTPLVFFTFSHNIILTYALTALPAMSILISHSLVPIAINKGEIRYWVYATSLFSPLVILIMLLFSQPHYILSKTSARGISHLFHSIEPPSEQPLGYVGGRSYSMEFYTNGKVSRYNSVAQALSVSSEKSLQFIALEQAYVDVLTKKQRQQMQLKGISGQYHLYEIQPRVLP